MQFLTAVLGLATAIVSALAVLPAWTTPADPARPVRPTEAKVVSETRLVPYTKDVTRYDHCGNPYTVRVTCVREVAVPVTPPVPVPGTKGCPN